MSQQQSSGGPMELTPSADRRESVPIRAWVRGVEMDDTVRQQLQAMAQMTNILHHPIAVMPDVHGGIGGAAVGSVVPTTRAIIPAAVGVDIGCGMIAAKTSLMASDLLNGPSTVLSELRWLIEMAVPHGRTHQGQAENDAGGWRQAIPKPVAEAWRAVLEPRFRRLLVKRPVLEKTNHVNHLGTLGSGNHFVEVCLDEQQAVWVMLHTGSRGVGARIGSIFIELAKADMRTHVQQYELPHADLAYLREGTDVFREYIEAVSWAQDYAKVNRELMLEAVLRSMRQSTHLQQIGKAQFHCDTNLAVNCHHNYVESYTVRTTDSGMEGKQLGTTESDGIVWLTRKGATSARKGQLAVIPGSMGAASYIVRGKGNALSYDSCSHGAGRRFSRGEATRRFTIADHQRATEGVECRKDSGVLDETPAAYKSIDAVMAAQSDLVEVVATLKQIICVKG